MRLKQGLLRPGEGPCPVNAEIIDG